MISEALIHGQLVSFLGPEAWQNFILDYVSLGRVKLCIKRKIHRREDTMNQGYSCHGREKMPASLDSPCLVFLCPGLQQIEQSQLRSGRVFPFSSVISRMAPMDMPRGTPYQYSIYQAHRIDSRCKCSRCYHN